MKYLMGIKACHRCARNRTCQKKNDPITLMDKPKIYEITNRSTTRHAMPPTKIASFCKEFCQELPLKEGEITPEAIEALKNMKKMINKYEEGKGEYCLESR